jgi:hypothetical protein
MNKELLLKTFRNTACAAIYIFIVSQIMRNGEKIFGKEDTMLVPFTILLLFSLSAAVVGGLIFGQSIMLFIENKKIEGIKAAMYSIGWLGLYTLLGLLVLFIVK